MTATMTTMEVSVGGKPMNQSWVLPASARFRSLVYVRCIIRLHSALRAQQSTWQPACPWEGKKHRSNNAGCLTARWTSHWPPLRFPPKITRGSRRDNQHSDVIAPRLQRMARTTPSVLIREEYACWNQQELARVFLCLSSERPHGPWSVIIRSSNLDFVHISQTGNDAYEVTS
jgi:hypothetical protein